MPSDATTGTVYGLVDPRDEQVRYIGETVRPLAVRLSGHVSGKKSRRVGQRMAELRAVGLRPRIVSIREGVPVDQLLAAEGEEITRILATGATLLNEVKTGPGRELHRSRKQAENAAAVQAGWAKLAAAAIETLGGPLPPGDLPEIRIPDVTWRFWSQVQPDHAQRLSALTGSGFPRPDGPAQWDLWSAITREQENATRELSRRMESTWGAARGIAGRDAFGERLEHCAHRSIETPCPSREEASRLLALSAWYMIAADPWRHLAQVAGLPLDNESFIAWAGRGAGVREALEFLAGHGERNLHLLAGDWEEARLVWHEEGPGRLLGTVAAAYAGISPASVICPEVVTILGKVAADHQLTAPMADLLVKLDRKALDTAFGPDVAADLDKELGLRKGTSGRVLRALAANRGISVGQNIRRIADRSAQVLEVTGLLDYSTWSGPSILGARVIGASLVHAGLAESKWLSSEDYLAKTRALWAPRPDPRLQQDVA